MGSHGSSRGSSNGSPRRSSRRSRRASLERPILLLHIISAILSLISIAIFVAIIPIWSSNFVFARGALRGDWPDALPILPLLLALGINSHYLLQRVLRKRDLEGKGMDYLKNRSNVSTIPSPLRLYLLLTIEILLLTFLILAGVTGMYRFWRPAVISSAVQMNSMSSASSLVTTLSARSSITDANPTNLLPPSGRPSASQPDQHQRASVRSCSISNVFTRQCNPTLYVIGGLQIAAIVVGSLVWLVNLIILSLHLREHRYQKRKLQRSLRAKAKARLEALEDNLSLAEKGDYSTRHKKIHCDKKEKRHEKSNSDSNSNAQTTTTSEAPILTRPHRAYTTPSSRTALPAVNDSVVRPKQYFYNPDISPSRVRPTRSNSAKTIFNHSGSQTRYSQAIQEARRTMRPAESMRDWLAGRNV